MEAVAVHEGAGTRMDPRVDVDRLFLFAFLMSAGCRKDAVEAGRLALVDVPSGGLEAIGALARRIEAESSPQAETSFVELEATLGFEATRPLDEAIDADENLLQLHWLMHRTCLVRALGCLPPKLRSAYVLTVFFHCSRRMICTLLEVSEAQVGVRILRAEKRLAAFFGPRCEHLDERNPCTCLGRLSVLSDGDFLPKEPAEQFPIAPVYRGRHQLRVLYDDMPRPRMTPAERASLMGEPHDD